MQSGRPSYTASYQPVGTGPYQVSVTQLLPGGLSATYWDNEWLVDAPAVQRVDAQVCERQAPVCSSVAAGVRFSLPQRILIEGGSHFRGGVGVFFRHFLRLFSNTNGYCWYPSCFD